MNEKIIITADGLSMAEALVYALGVVQEGRISGNGKCYCYVTSFSHRDGDRVTVYASLNDKSDRLVVTKGKS